MDARYHYRIDGRDVYVIDDAFSDEIKQGLWKELRAGGYNRGWFNRADTRQYKHFAKVLDPERFQDHVVGRIVTDAFRKFYGYSDVDVLRAYSNMGLYGDSCYPHRDADPPSDHVTAIIYANEEWHVDWGGETLFYNEERDAVAAVSPKPGRMVLFPGEIIHRGGLVNRECYEPRILLAVKLKPVAPEATDSPATGNAAPRAKPRSPAKGRKTTRKKTARKSTTRRKATAAKAKR